MRHAHAVGLHRVTLPVVKVAHIGVVEVRDLLLARHRPRAAPRLRVLLASAGKQDWSGGSRGRGGGRAKADRRGSRARREERRNARTWGVCDRAKRLGVGVPARSRANAQGPAPGKADVRDTLITERAGSAGSGSSRTCGDTPRTLRSEIQEFLGRAEELVSGRVRSARASFWCVLARARLGVNLRAQSFPAHQPAITWREFSASHSSCGLLGFRFGFRSIAIGAFSVVVRNSPVVLQFHPV